MRIILATLLVFAWIDSAASAQNGCLEPGDSDFVYPVGNIIKFCGEQRQQIICHAARVQMDLKAKKMASQNFRVQIIPLWIT
jgi:hypothetical protein